MPMLIDHIDKIARDKQRDVLYLDFSETPCISPDDFEPINNYRKSEIRDTLIAWFKNNNILVKPCGSVANECRMEGYRGQIYIDVPFDRENIDYKKVEALLENPDGTSKIPSVLFCYCPLSLAMENAHHDAPGYWDSINL